MGVVDGQYSQQGVSFEEKRRATMGSGQIGCQEGRMGLPRISIHWGSFLELAAKKLPTCHCYHLHSCSSCKMGSNGHIKINLERADGKGRPICSRGEPFSKH
ncbi:hypothetical protein SLA2020_448410 [Shorea laevis]